MKYALVICLIMFGTTNAFSFVMECSGNNFSKEECEKIGKEIYGLFGCSVSEIKCLKGESFQANYYLEKDGGKGSAFGTKFYYTCDVNTTNCTTASSKENKESDNRLESEAPYCSAGTYVDGSKLNLPKAYKSYDIGYTNGLCKLKK